MRDPNLLPNPFKSRRDEQSHKHYRNLLQETIRTPLSYLSHQENLDRADLPDRVVDGRLKATSNPINSKWVKHKHRDNKQNEEKDAYHATFPRGFVTASKAEVGKKKGEGKRLRDDENEEYKGLIAKPAKMDVISLTGSAYNRSKEILNHPGNVKFRELLLGKFDKWKETAKGWKRKDIVFNIIKTILKDGRFLQKKANEGWEVMGESAVQRKVYDALYNMEKKFKKKQKRSVSVDDKKKQPSQADDEKKRSVSVDNEKKRPSQADDEKKRSVSVDNEKKRPSRTRKPTNQYDDNLEPVDSDDEQRQLEEALQNSRIAISPAPPPINNVPAPVSNDRGQDPPAVQEDSDSSFDTIGFSTPESADYEFDSDNDSNPPARVGGRDANYYKNLINKK